MAAILRQRIVAADAEVLAAKQKAAAASAQSPSATATPPANQEEDALTKAMQELEAMRASQQQLMQQIQLLQGRGAAPGGAQSSQSASPQAQGAAIQPQAASQMCISTVLSTDAVYEEASPTMLPKLQPPPNTELGKRQLAAYGHLHQLLLLWNRGGCQPVSFGELRTHSLASQETHIQLKGLAGQQLWDGWFALVGDSPEDCEPVPRQALAYAALALDGMKSLYEDAEKTRKTAEEAYLAFTTAAKKRKLEGAAS